MLPKMLSSFMASSAVLWIILSLEIWYPSLNDITLLGYSFGLFRILCTLFILTLLLSKLLPNKRDLFDLLYFLGLKFFGSSCLIFVGYAYITHSNSLYLSTACISLLISLAIPGIPTIKKRPRKI